MNAAGRLTAFGAGLAVAFTAAYVTAAAVVPDTAATSPQTQTSDAAADHSAPLTEQASPVVPFADPPGLSLAERGYVLSPVRSPSAPDDRGTLSFTIVDPGGTPLLDYATVHDKQLHLIVVRSDGQHFAHVHPRLDVATAVDVERRRHLPRVRRLPTRRGGQRQTHPHPNRAGGRRVRPGGGECHTHRG